MPRKQARQAVRNKAVVASVSWTQRVKRVLLKIGVTLGCLAVLLGAFVTGSHLMDLRVEQLVLEGAVEHVAVTELEMQLAPTLQASFLTLDLMPLLTDFTVLSLVLSIFFFLPIIISSLLLLV